MTKTEKNESVNEISTSGGFQFIANHFKLQKEPKAVSNFSTWDSDNYRPTYSEDSVAFRALKLGGKFLGRIIYTYKSNVIIKMTDTQVRTTRPFHIRIVVCNSVGYPEPRSEYRASVNG
jgi:hypothetical protein